MADDKTSNEPAEDSAPAARPAGGGGLKAWLPLMVTMLLMPALAFGVAQFVILPQLQKGLGIKTATGGEAGSAPKKPPGDAKQESVIMSKLLVNVADTMGARYLLVSLSVIGNSSDFKQKMADRDAQLRDMACGDLSTKTLADLEKPGERNVIRNELITGFNNVLGDSAVQEIYLTEFAIQ
ncbi:MAG TPA: flagellar basal body-associated FliL family protein [Candidatus Acidoferrum sp.]|nr:flagellar basal body-associated FliL family protein [Candidatus Acidoferrum sp.]